MTTVACVHRWRIEPPAGATSAGVCLNCGATRQFKNGPEKGRAHESGWAAQNNAKKRHMRRAMPTDDEEEEP